MGILGAITGFLSGPIESLLETRRVKKQAQAEALTELAKAEAQKKIAKVKAEIIKIESEAKIKETQAEADVNWEEIWATQASKSWKDEYWTIALSIPMFMAFIPGLRETALSGFLTIEQMPEWYIIALLSAIGAAFGLRALTKWVRK